MSWLAQLSPEVQRFFVEAAPGVDKRPTLRGYDYGNDEYDARWEEEDICGGCPAYRFTRVIDGHTWVVELNYDTGYVSVLVDGYKGAKPLYDYRSDDRDVLLEIDLGLWGIDIPAIIEADIAAAVRNLHEFDAATARRGEERELLVSRLQMALQKR